MKLNSWIIGLVLALSLQSAAFAAEGTEPEFFSPVRSDVRTEQQEEAYIEATHQGSAYDNCGYNCYMSCFPDLRCYNLCIFRNCR